MPLVPLLPIFHRLNQEHFDGALQKGENALVLIRWSDGRLRKTAGLYRRFAPVFGKSQSEILLSRPVLENLPLSALESTLCHEMIHAWVDLVLKVQEGHGPNFHNRMNLINSVQNKFQVSVRHQFPLPTSIPKWVAVCPSCHSSFPYKRLVKGAACRKCCNLYFGGKWNASCLLEYKPYEK